MKQMISRRNFVTIAMMMAVLFLLFQFSLVLKDQGNQYDENEFLSNSTLSSDQVWTPEVLADGDTPSGEYVVYMGSEKQDLYQTIEQWCTYRKMALIAFEHVQDYQIDIKNPPEVILIDGAHLDLKQDVPVLQTLKEKYSVPLVFCTIPEADILIEHRDYMLLLGITGISEPEEEVVGIHVFSDFLLGGERFYQPSKVEVEDDPMDLELDFPYYRVFNGSKTYIIGMFEETPEKTENQPPLLWRYATTETQVYVVAGDFLKKLSGIGYLNAIMAEIREYDIYPVVNAQVLSIVNYPGLAEDHSEEIEEIYSRGQSSFYQDLIWPSMISVMQNSGFYPTFFLTPQINYGVEAPISEDALEYFLKQFKEQGVEAGISLKTYKTSWLQEKISRDSRFLNGVNNNYKYGAFYSGKNQLGKLADYQNTSLLADARTIISDGTGEYDFIDYYDTDITLQGITSDASDFHYSDDLELKGYETGLGYTNVLFDMTVLSWPEEEKDEWQNVAKIFSSNISTYWKSYSYFDRVTASEADRRIRNFLALSYRQEREDNDIRVEIEQFQDDAWFVLRLHGEDVVEVSGGSFVEMEKGIFLIHAQQETVSIAVESTAEQIKIR